jgi:hypothetical protein
VVVGGAAAQPYNPTINPAHFVGQITNPYLGFAPNRTFSYRKQTDEGVETTEVHVTTDTVQIMGVTCTVVRDREFLDEELIEDTFDWFAQDIHGNVWYFGEDTTEYQNGVPVSTFGSWKAGENGALPGVIMLAEPKVGKRYRQEYAVGVAEDWAQVKGLNAAVTVPYGVFTQCLRTKDWSALEHGNFEFKYYKAGVGLVLEVDKEGGRNELISIGP